MNAKVQDLERAHEVDRMSDQELREHYARKHPPYHPDDDLPQGDEPTYGDPDE